MTPAKCILLIDDHPAIRHGVRLLLERFGMSVFEAESLETALDSLEILKPDLVLVDLGLGDDDGIDLLSRLAEEHPSVPALIYSMFEDVVHIQRALHAGARGYVTKREPAELLVKGVQEGLAGMSYLSPRVMQRLEEDRDEPNATMLSPKEMQVFDLLGQGFSTSSIAARLDLSPKTVETYYARMVFKLDLPGTKDLRQRAIVERG